MVKRDALDPDFAANLSRLGPVQTNSPQFVPAIPAAHRTLSARRDEMADLSAVPPKGYLTAPLLSRLFDELKGCKTDQARQQVYDRYSLKSADVETMRRWVNSPSVGEIKTYPLPGGEETEMKAVWVEGGK